MFKPIRATNRTDSRVILTRISEDIHHLKKPSANSPPKNGNSQIFKKSDLRGGFSHAFYEKFKLISEISKIDEKMTKNVSWVTIDISGHIFIVLKVRCQHLLMVKKIPRRCFSHAHPYDIKNVPDSKKMSKNRFFSYHCFGGTRTLDIHYIL